VDVDVATPDPEVAARIYAGLSKGAIFPLSEKHGAWRVAFKDGTTVDFTPLAGTIEDDLRTRDFTINAIAEPVAGGDYVDPLGGRADLEARTLRAVSETIFEYGSRTSSASLSTNRRRGSSAATQASSATRQASESSTSSSGFLQRASSGLTSSVSSSRSAEP
jgi:Poly A polymerase head domain